MPITVYLNINTHIQLEDAPLAPPGNEGAVHKIITPGYSKFCIKIYHAPKRTPERMQKLEFMIKNQPSNLTSESYIICWPTNLVYNSSNISASSFIGFMLPLAHYGSEKLFELCIPVLGPRFQQTFKKYQRDQSTGVVNRLKICVNISIAIHNIHSTNKYAIIDFKPQNVLVNPEGKISIIDVDSFQIHENKRVLHHSLVATPEYSPKEATMLNPAKSYIPESWDRFSIAVSFYEIILGIHPYAATGKGTFASYNTLHEKIQHGLFVHGGQRHQLSIIPPLHQNFIKIPKSIQELFIKAFDEGHQVPDNRPSASDWGQRIFHELDKQKNMPSNYTFSGYTPPPQQPVTPQPAPPPPAQPNNAGVFWAWLIIIAIIAIALFIYNRSLASQLNQSTTKLENVAQYYPIVISGVTYTTFGQKEPYGVKLKKNDVDFIHPVISYQPVADTYQDIELFIKFFDPFNRLLALSGNDYTFRDTLSMYPSDNYMSFKCKGWGTQTPGSYYIDGTYHAEIWYKDRLLYQNNFTITN